MAGRFAASGSLLHLQSRVHQYFDRRASRVTLWKTSAASTRITAPVSVGNSAKSQADFIRKMIAEFDPTGGFTVRVNIITANLVRRFMRL
jgi:hypothetical protein